MKLYATPRSHFARKVRLLLDHLDIAYEMDDMGNVAEAGPESLRGNPMMTVPVLEDGDAWLIESDHIARYIAATYDAGDRFQVLTHDVDRLNALAVINSIMTNEVKLVMARRTGVEPDGLGYFERAKTSIAASLDWLEQRARLFGPTDLSYMDFAFICMWDHLKLYGLVPMDHPKLSDSAQALAQSEDIQASAPPPV